MQNASPGTPATLTTKADSVANQATIVKNDEIPLEQINSIIKAGETEELREGFSVWSLGALLVCLMATWEALATVVASALTNGGPPCLFYNYIISFLGTLALAASMAEMASMFPTAGGQYHWVAMFAPAKIRPLAS
ncbi:Putative amino acid/polyamine transporter I [Septoria linicola]|uniref:Amino acid/polyamine transporter I n=1 Tax=Septoria linicola TaxID=215465 RepID=A0A9Q9AUY5_9PEZI|nr:putative amino acid/polyamine transporter I [Septoria linicola]USW56347.1 Putative amino acid/polyamine transporter I [Septoria linicola]